MDELTKFQYSQADRTLVLGLTITPGLGRKSIRKIIFYLKKHELKTDDFWVQMPAIFSILNIENKIAKKIKKDNFEQKIDSFLKQNKAQNIRVLCFWETEYPQALLETSDFPLVLFVTGNTYLLQTRSIAVVGTRRVTSYGTSVTQELVAGLVYENFTIVSGGMYGVDYIAHQVAVDSHGKTIVVLGQGFCSKTSDYYKKLHAKVLKNDGCILSEYPLGFQASKYTFRERNRIVAGLSLGVLVIEAALKSGTHITVGCALDAGREVFAVPGSIFNPFSEGTKYLVNQGAKLVTTTADIVAEFQKPTTIPDSRAAVLALNLGDIEKKVVLELRAQAQSVNSLAKKLELEIQELLPILTLLELENIVHNEAGVWQCVLSYSGHA